MVLRFALIAAVALAPFAGRTADVSATSDERAILELTNREREKNGLSALAWNAELTVAARLHSKNMAAADKLAHTLNGSTMTQRIKDAGYAYLSIGENIAFNQHGPAEVVEAWMHSPGHRANILNKEYTELGLGIVKNEKGENYFTQDFGRPVSAGPTESAKFTITNHGTKTATVILPGGDSKTVLEPGVTGSMQVSGTGDLPPAEIRVESEVLKLAFEDGGTYIILSTPQGTTIENELKHPPTPDRK